MVGQGLARQSTVEREDYPTLAALGVDRRQLITLGWVRNLVVGVAGAAFALVVAVALSPVAPLGEARVVESSSGILFDTPVLLLGALGIVAAVLALGIWPAARAARTGRPRDPAMASRPSSLAGLLAAAGAPATAVIGVRTALERRSGGASVPVGSALLGTVLAVVALVGTAVFGASLTHLTATPALYGDRFALNITDPPGGAPDPVMLRQLEHDRAVTAITHGFATEIAVNNVGVGAVAGTGLRGPLIFSTVAGHLPTGSRQIALGGSTMQQTGAGLGSLVRVAVTSPAGTRRTGPFRVVGQVSLPVLGGAVGLGSGAVLTINGYDSLACPGTGQTVCRTEVQAQGQGSGLLVGVAPGPRGEALVTHYLDAYPAFAAGIITPTSLINFGEAVNFPLIFGAMLAIFGAATLAHLLVVSVSRPPPGRGTAQGRGIREPPGRLGRRLAGHHVGARRHRDRRPGGRGGRGGDLARVRRQPGRRPRRRRAERAHRGPGGRRHRRGEPHRGGARPGGDPRQGGRPPADRMTPPGSARRSEPAPESGGCSGHARAGGHRTPASCVLDFRWIERN